MGFAIGASVWALATYVLLRQFMPRILDIWERKYPLQTSAETIELPPEIAAYVSRFQRKESIDSETAYFREQYHTLGKNWQRVLVANPQIREWEMRSIGAA